MQSAKQLLRLGSNLTQLNIVSITITFQTFGVFCYLHIIIKYVSVFEPSAIRNQMVFSQWVMLKMFLGAMGSGMYIPINSYSRPLY